MSGALPGSVVIGGYVNALGAVRSLAEDGGIPVDVVLTMPQDICQHSRWVRRHLSLLELAARPDALLELLDREARAWRGWTLTPTNDHALAVLSRHHEELSRNFVLTFPPWDVTRKVLDKRETYAAARALGIEMPRSWGPATRANTSRTEIELPVVVKPAHGHLFAERFGKKLFYVRRRDDLVRIVDDVEAAGIECEILDMIPGPDSNTYSYQVYLDPRGIPLAEFSMRKLRQSPPLFGVSRAAVTAHAPELREPTIELLRSIGWRGIASVQYKRDPRSGRFLLLEINGRCFLPHGLARRAGINFPLLSHHEHLTGERAGVRPNGWEGYWIHLHADLLYTVLCLGREEMDWKVFLRSYAGPKTFAVWSRRDPKPFFMEWLHTLKKAPRVLLRREERALLLGRVQRGGPLRPSG